MLRESEKKEALYRYTEVNSYDNPSHIFALDYYKPGSNGTDDFSRKEAWFYYLGGDDLKEEFSMRMTRLMDDLFVNNTVEWDYFTLAPSKNKDGLNGNMLDLSEAISEGKGIEYRQILRRKREVEENGEMSSVKMRKINQKDSVEITEDVEGDNIIILDNVSVSGIFLTYLTDELMKAGAKRVCCVVLGVTNHYRGVKRLEKDKTASSALMKEEVAH